MQDSKVLGITGAIGAGKSVVSRVLSSLGVPLFDCDSYGKMAYEDPKIHSALRSLLGNDAFLSNSNKPNKAYIAQKVFGDSERLSALEAIIHPFVLSSFEEWKKQQKASWVVIESAILREKGWDSFCQSVWFVTASEEERLRRVMLRDHISREDALVRIEYQNQLYADSSFKENYVEIINDSQEPLLPQIFCWSAKIGLPILSDC